MEKGTFPYKGNVSKKKEKEQSEEELEVNKFFEYVENGSKSINYDLFEKHFNLLAPTVLAKQIIWKKKANQKNSEFVNLIKSGLEDLKDEIEKMPEDEKKWTAK